MNHERYSEGQNDNRDNTAKKFLGNFCQNTLAHDRADDYAGGSQREELPNVAKLMGFRDEVNRHACGINHERDGCCRRHKRLLLNLKAEQCRRAYAALITYETAENSRGSSCQPSRGSAKPDARRNTGCARDSGEDQQCAQDVAQAYARKTGVQESSRETAEGACNAESQQHALVDVLADQHESQNSSHHVGNRYSCNRELGSQLGGQGRGQNAADTKSRYGGDAAPDQRSDKKNQGEDHRGSNSSPNNSRTFCLAARSALRPFAVAEYTRRILPFAFCCLERSNPFCSMLCMMG